MREGLFIATGLFTIGCAAAVVFSKNAVYSAFALVNSLFGLAVLYLLWGSSFMAAVQILIYAGAIVVLFVFVVMLLNLGREGARPTNWLLLGSGAALVWTFALFFLRALNPSPVANPPKMLQFKELCFLLFEKYLWPFEILTFFLLILIVGIFALAREEEHGK